ncbi:hypothetical protein GCM10023225_17300 [Kineococcus glutinatus]|uniref:PPM-type phosphatase domain-containing protein n=1 Tax=Kineococcus glutinatus TaxID=1070872 RepID=A0ABP9HS77_9ACTN
MASACVAGTVAGIVAAWAGVALERARLHEHTADVARHLQRSLLAGEPPRDERYAVAAVYRPGVETLEVGGDFYDVVDAGGGALAVVVGDVVGRGLEAAAAMGQLRSAVRALAPLRAGPAQLLTRLDAFADQVEAAGMATVAHAELDLATGALRYACAGHLPPVLVRARGRGEGRGELLWGGRSTPLGAYAPGRSRGDALVHLRPGDRLLLCTDGLVERRDRELDAGLEVLAAVAARAGRLPLGEAVAAVAEELLRDEDHHDDVCVLLLEWRGAGVAAGAAGPAPGPAQRCPAGA